MGDIIKSIADFLGNYPLFIALIGGGLYMLLRSRFVSLRYLPYALKEIRRKNDSTEGQISSAQALASVVAATIGLGNIVGVAVALVVGGPGAIFWMWVSALVGMSTKFHEGVLAIMYRGRNTQGDYVGGPMYIIENGLGRRWRPLAVAFAVAGMFGTLCIVNANQLTEAVMTVFTSPQGLSDSSLLSSIASATGLSNEQSFRLLFGLFMAFLVSLVVLRGVKRIARIASVLVPFMVAFYFIMVLYIILTHLPVVPRVFGHIFADAFSLKAGFGALCGVALIGARRAAVVNDAGVGTASIMHGQSRNSEPVREGLVAMLGPSIDSGLVCTLTALALLICMPELLVTHGAPTGGVKGMEVAMGAFSAGVPYGEYLLMLIVICFAFSSMFSYSFYGSRCAAYLFGERGAKFYTYFFIATLVVFAVIQLDVALGLCDLFYALMVFPTMFSLIVLSPRVWKATREYFDKIKRQKPDTTN